MKFSTLYVFLLLLVIACNDEEMTTDKSNPTTVRVAAAQIFCLDGDKPGNLVRIENAMKEAKAAEVDIICFPEMALMGWVNPDAHQQSQPIPGADSDTLAALARKYQMYMAIGLGEKDGDQLYDSAILLDPNGEILLKHRKVNILTELMDPPYTPGKGVQVVETEFGKIGVMICADSFVEEVKQEMTDLAPDLLLIPYGWAKEVEDWPGHGLELEKTVTSTAKAIGCPVLGTDLVGEISQGPWRGLVYGGQSLIVDAEGKVLKKGLDRDRDLLIVDLPLAKD
ncbi:MAG: carbon-nitrogen hydrolase family protein [Saprospiraceae bacterium]|nr:carbon-nitrogen hydrolase family protein [Saprospiraceae bacterium]